MSAQKKNVGLLIQTLSGGGAERVVSRLSHILNDDYNIFVILFDNSYRRYEVAGTLINLNVPAVTNLTFRKCLLPFRRACILKKIKKDYKLDIVFSFMDSPNLVNLLSMCKTCKSVLSIRNYTDSAGTGFINERIWPAVMRLLYNRADCIIPVSRMIEENLVDKYKVKRDIIYTIYNPFDLEEIKQLAKETVEKEFSDFATKGKTIISVGRRTYQKGFWHLIKAFSLVHEKDAEARLIIIGKDESDGKLEKLVGELGLDKSVRLMGFTENPFKYMQNSDIYVLSSLFEGFPNALVEAMACGCAIVAADCKSGPREILYKKPSLAQECQGIETADFGILTEKLSPETNWVSDNLDDSERTLAEALMLLINNKVMKEDYSEKAKRRVTDFSYQKCKNAYIEIIEHLGEIIEDQG